MPDLLQLTAGKLIQATDPSKYVTLTGGRIVAGASEKGLQLTGGRRVTVTALSATIDATDACDDDPGTAAGNCKCVCVGAVGSGWMFWVRWNHTGCSDSTMHISIWRKVGAGSWLEYVDGLGCDSDNATCTPGCEGATEGTYEGGGDDTSGGTTTTWDWRVYIHADSDHSVIDGPAECPSVERPGSSCIMKAC